MKKITFVFAGLIIKAKQEGIKGNTYRLRITDFEKKSSLEVVANYDKNEFTFFDGNRSLLIRELRSISTIEDAICIATRDFEHGIKTVREIGRGSKQTRHFIKSVYAFDILGGIYHCSIVKNMKKETIRIHIQNEKGEDKQAFFDGAEWKTESGFYSGDRKLAIAMLERMSGIEIKEG